jgi:hypothetical protein
VVRIGVAPLLLGIVAMLLRLNGLPAAGDTVCLAYLAVVTLTMRERTDELMARAQRVSD